MVATASKRLAEVRSSVVAYFVGVDHIYCAVHFRRYAAQLDVFMKRRGAGLQLDATTGRGEYEEIQRRLDALYAELSAALPQYTRARMRSHAAWADVIEAANRHRPRDVPDRVAAGSIG
jgi:hypothetical protein